MRTMVINCVQSKSAFVSILSPELEEGRHAIKLCEVRHVEE